MNRLNTPIFKFIILLLAVGVLSFGAISAINMNHDGDMGHNTCPVASALNCGLKTNQLNLCVDYHLGMIKTLSTAAPWDGAGGILNLLLIGFMSLLFYILLPRVGLLYSKLKARIKHLSENVVPIFYIQLGYWIGLIEKREPAYSFALVQRGFSY